MDGATGGRFGWVPCPVCGEWAHELVYRKRDLRFLCSDREFAIVRCLACGTGRVLDPPERLADFYPPAFYASNHAGSGREEPLRRKLALVESLAGAPAGRRLLDFGCAGGEFVLHARSHGWDAAGYEWSPLPERQDHVVRADRPDGCFPDESFDVVTAWAVMEHVEHLRDSMSVISHIMRPGGMFVALVTNFASIPGRLMQQDDIPRHLNLFTRAGMTRLLESHGFRPLRWIFSDDIFSGTHRGLLVFLLKRLFGEPWADIVAQHRAPGRRGEFCGMLRGRPSGLTRAVCAFDREIFAPALDALANRLGFGFTMTVAAEKIGRGA